ncbi:MAG: DUF2255 family protein [Thermoproteota archaeon]|nr:DUF2255 family protein [Thermoproteota archaeon]
MHKRRIQLCWQPSTSKPISDTLYIYTTISKEDVHQKLDTNTEITLSVKGRRSGKEIPRPVWFVHEGDILYLLPVQGSGTKWYKNMLAGSVLKISIEDREIYATGTPITDGDDVEKVVSKFRDKYGEGEVKKYYSKFDVAVEAPL